MSQDVRLIQAIRVGVGFWLGIGLLLSGCAGISPNGLEPESKPMSGQPTSGFEAKSDATAALLPVRDLREDVLMRQHVTVKWSDGEESFDAVFQKRGSTLLLMGLGPMNTVGFRLMLDSEGVSFENRSGRDLPFEPERILSDVQRVFYPWLEESQGCVNCERSEIVDGLEVSERTGPRFLEERSFQWVAEPERGRIVVRYEGWSGDPAFPRRAMLDNGWFGYQLVVETASAERVD